MVADLKQVTKFFGVESGRAQQVLGGVDLLLKPGETVAIVGSSGSGRCSFLVVALWMADIRRSVVIIVAVATAVARTCSRYVGLAFLTQDE